MSWLRRWAWLPALLLSCWFVPWCIRVALHFDTFGIHRDIAPFAVRLGEQAQTMLRTDLRRARVALGSWLPSGGEALPRVDLAVAPAGLAALAADAPYSGRQWVPAVVDLGGGALAAEIRGRGDTYAHWGRPKPSLRVRLRNGARWHDVDTFNLSAPKYPEQLNNELCYVLARQLGLLAPFAQMVELRGACRGLYLMVQQPGPGLLRQLGHPRGALCSGELLARDAWTGVDNELFTRAALWEIDAYGGTRAGEAEVALQRLLTALAEPLGEGAAATLDELLDLRQFARLSVLEQLTQTHHFDHFHNWRLYWDPARGRFAPLVWDPVGWQQNMRPATAADLDLHPCFSVLHEHLHVHAGFLLERDRLLTGWFAAHQDRELLAGLAAELPAVQAVVARDPLLCPPDTAAVLAAQSGFADAVGATIEALRQRWFAGEVPRWRVADAGELRLQVASPHAEHGVELQFEAPVAPRSVILAVDRADGTRARIDLAGHWHTRGSSLFASVDLPAATSLTMHWRAGGDPNRTHRLVTAPTGFVLSVEGVDLREVTAVRLGGRTAAPDPDLRAAPVDRLVALEALRF